MVQSPIDFVILALVATVVALIVRGMLRGTISTCDPESCSGSCARCKRPCSQPHLTLSEAQQAELREIDRRAREMEMTAL